MIGVAVHLRYNPRPDYYLDKIRIEATSLGATDLIIIDETTHKMGSYFTTSELTVHTFDTLTEAESAFPGVTFVYLEPARILDELVSTPLNEFTHPVDCIYVTGPDPSSISRIGREDEAWVHVPVLIDNGVFYAETVQILALYDRNSK